MILPQVLSPRFVGALVQQWNKGFAIHVTRWIFPRELQEGWSEIHIQNNVVNTATIVTCQIFMF